MSLRLGVTSTKGDQIKPTHQLRRFLQDPPRRIQPGLEVPHKRWVLDKVLVLMWSLDPNPYLGPASSHRLDELDVSAVVDTGMDNQNTNYHQH